jgi:Mn2+/Fe2+ NRAMP family transporter
MTLLTRLVFTAERWKKAVKLFLVLAGPGLIVMIADNDAGGITTYAATGAQFGNNLNWFLVLLLPVAYFVQEMTARLGAVTKHGHAEAIFSSFGVFWGWFSLLDLVMTDWLTQITEFSGMTSALSIFGIPRAITVLGVLILMSAIILSGKYWTWEKITLLFCALNLIYIPLAIWVHPDPNSLLAGFKPNIPGGFNNNFFFFIMANIGTTIAPWMIFFQQSATVDKGLQEKDLRWAKMDTFIGSILTVVTAIVIVIVTGTLLYGQPINDAAQAAREISKTNRLWGAFMAIGLFDAGLLGALCISLASSWAWGEVFGIAHSLNRKVKDAPWFYVVYLLLLAGAGMVVLIPNAPLVLITLFVQVIAVTLLPSALVFLLLLLNDRQIVGKFKNTRAQNVIVGFIIIAIVIMSTLYAVSAIFPAWFADDGPAIPFFASLFTGVPFWCAIGLIAAIIVLFALVKPARRAATPLLASINAGFDWLRKFALALLWPVGKLFGFVFWPVGWLAKQVGLGRKIEDISKRYKIPAIRMTGAVKFCLLILRLYLLGLVGLLVFKFVLTLAGK